MIYRKSNGPRDACNEIMERPLYVHVAVYRSTNESRERKTRGARQVQAKVRHFPPGISEK